MISLARRGRRPLRIGHRGAAALAPENTLSSFRAAIAAGVDLVEFDVLQLYDGELVVAHSSDLHEVSHGATRGTLDAMGLDALREICPELPTFDEALAFFAEEAREIGVHVDLKAGSAASNVAAALRRFGLLERTLVSSFHFGALRDLVAIAPGLRTGVSFPRDRLRVHGRRGFDPVVGGGLRSLRPFVPGLVGFLLTRSRASALVLHQALVSPRAVGRAHEREVPVVAWTVDDPVDLARVEAAGVDAVVTNDPSIFVSTLEA